MPSTVRSVLLIRCVLFILEICHTNAQNLPSAMEDHLAAEQNQNERINPVTSYYRHNIYGPNSYAFGFEVNDKTTGNIQFRDEKRYGNGSVQGSYGYVRPDGTVSITHFMADPEQGYLSQTQNFEPGDQAKWMESWPTKKTDIIMDKPPESIQPQVKYDEKEKLNLTSILLPVEPLKAEHGIDLNPTNLEKELVNPAVLEVINGEAPLIRDDKKKNDGGVGFETINKFFPADFPIVPFQLPQETKDDTNTKNKKDDKPQSQIHKYNEQKINNSEKVLHDPDLLPSPAEKYVKSKENNAEKSLPAETLRMATQESPKKEGKKSLLKSKALSVAKSDWYERIINQARQEYLRGLK